MCLGLNNANKINVNSCILLKLKALSLFVKPNQKREYCQRYCDIFGLFILNNVLFIIYFSLQTYGYILQCVCMCVCVCLSACMLI